MPLGELCFGLGNLFFQLPIDFSLRREQRPGKRRDGAIHSDPVEKLFNPADTLRGYEPELGCVAADGICHLRSHLDQTFADTDQHQRCLLLGRLYRYEPHRWPAHRLTNGLRIRSIVFSALHIRFDQLRRDQFDFMAIRGQQPCQVVGRATGLECQAGRRQFLEEHQHVRSPQLPAEHRLLGGIHPVKLENVL